MFSNKVRGHIAETSHDNKPFQKKHGFAQALTYTYTVNIQPATNIFYLFSVSEPSFENKIKMF